MFRRRRLRRTTESSMFNVQRRTRVRRFRCVCARSTSDLCLRFPKQTMHSIPASARRLASPPRALVAQRAAFASHLRRATKRPDTGKGGWDAVIAGRCPRAIRMSEESVWDFLRARDAEAHAHHLTRTRVRMRMMSTMVFPACCVLRGALLAGFLAVGWMHDMAHADACPTCR